MNVKSSYTAASAAPVYVASEEPARPTCLMCGKPFEFAKNRRGGTKQVTCGPQCRHEMKLRYMRARYHADSERHRDYSRRWHAENRERAQTTKQRWRDRNRERLNANNRIISAKDPEALKAKRHGYYLKSRERLLAQEKQRKYGLTGEELEQLLRDQGGHCAMCSEAHGLQIDHDHATGKVRGLLCGPHNRMLANAHDAVYELRAGIEYLKRSR